MTYKKKYNKALEIAKSLQECSSNPEITAYLSELFPELKEYNEQKPVKNSGPKFKVGDWVACEELNTSRITGMRNTYKVEIIDGSEGFPDINYVDKFFHLWTIRDAKPGDVLFARNFNDVGGCIFLFEGIDNWNFDAEGYRAVATGHCCAFTTGSNMTEFGVQGPDCIEVEMVCPATKEQRDLLFQKMKEAGYEWDCEKLEVRKIEQKPTECSTKGEMGLDGHKNIELIPLTAEILEKNFAKDPQWKYGYYINDDIHIYEEYDGIWGIQYMELIKIKYVHELQCVLSLLKIDKEIMI